MKCEARWLPGCMLWTDPHDFQGQDSKADSPSGFSFSGHLPGKLAQSREEAQATGEATLSGSQPAASVSLQPCE